MPSVNALSSSAFTPAPLVSTQRQSLASAKIGSGPTSTSPPPATSPPVGTRATTAPNLAKAALLKAKNAVKMQSSHQPQPAVYGDVNGDGVFNNADASALLQHLFGGSASPGPSGLENADANGDGNVDISDAVHLLNILRGQGPYTSESSSAAAQRQVATVKNPVGPAGNGNGSLPTFITSR